MSNCAFEYIILLLDKNKFQMSQLFLCFICWDFLSLPTPPSLSLYFFVKGTTIHFSLRDADVTWYRQTVEVVRKMKIAKSYKVANRWL